jgi:hypothetical protein
MPAGHLHNQVQPRVKLPDLAADRAGKARSAASELTSPTLGGVDPLGEQSGDWIIEARQVVNIRTAGAALDRRSTPRMGVRVSRDSEGTRTNTRVRRDAMLPSCQQADRPITG